MKITSNQTIHFFPSKEAAAVLANSNNEVADEGEEYRIIENEGGKFFVALFDNNEFVATL